MIRTASLLAALGALGGCSLTRRPVRVVDTHYRPAQQVGPYTHPRVALPLPEEGEARVVVQVLEEPEASVAVVRTDGTATLLCSHNPCSFSLPAGQQSLEIFPPIDETGARVADRIDLRVVAGEDLLVTHRASQVEETATGEWDWTMRAVGMFVEFFGWPFLTYAVVNDVATGPVFRGPEWSPSRQRAITWGIGAAGAVVGIVGYSLGRPQRVRRTLAPGATEVVRHRPELTE